MLCGFPQMNEDRCGHQGELAGTRGEETWLRLPECPETTRAPGFYEKWRFAEK